MAILKHIICSIKKVHQAFQNSIICFQIEIWFSFSLFFSSVLIPFIKALILCLIFQHFLYFLLHPFNSFQIDLRFFFSFAKLFLNGLGYCCFKDYVDLVFQIVGAISFIMFLVRKYGYKLKPLSQKIASLFW